MNTKKNSKGTKGANKYIAIDFGTYSTKVYIKNEKVSFEEATLIAYDAKNHNKIVSIGNNVRQLLGKTNENIILKYPLKFGSITDIRLAKTFLEEIFKAKGYENIWKNSYILIACPFSITNMERDFLLKMCKDLGAKYSEIQDDAKLALMGIGHNIFDSKGRMILDIGGGKVTAAIIAANETIYSKSIKSGGYYIDDEIKKFAKTYYTLSIGAKTAEMIKEKIGCLVMREHDSKDLLVFGRDVSSHLPKEIYISGNQINKIIVDAFGPIINLISDVMANGPSEVVKDIITDGIDIVGGVSKIKGIKEYLKECFKIHFKTHNDCTQLIIKGAIAYEDKLINNYNGIYNELSLDRSDAEK